MKSVSRMISWKTNVALSAIVLVLLFIASFYGLYSNRFYILKPDNYIFPFLTLVHFAFLYVLWFKIRANEATDPIMRNLEYALYVILFVYIFKFFDTMHTLLSYKDLGEYSVPDTFLPVGISIVLLHALLVFLTLLAFGQRKVMVGNYHFEDANTGFDTW